ncbi:MAG: MarR family transcriptional regulator [Bacteroidetes bacterium]|nr:MAG: MarR family transcriptional regulator [Bacteroidota bacterium]
MNTVSKIFSKPNALHLDNLLADLVAAFNSKREAILASYNVTELEVQIIRYLTDQEQKKMKEVGEHFGIKLSTLTSTVDKLEKNRLVKRRNSKDDRRVIYIKPTSRGQSLLTELDGASRLAIEPLEADMEAEEYAAMVRGLERVLSVLEA